MLASNALTLSILLMVAFYLLSITNHFKAEKYKWLIYPFGGCSSYIPHPLFFEKDRFLSLKSIYLWTFYAPQRLYYMQDS